MISAQATGQVAQLPVLHLGRPRSQCDFNVYLMLFPFCLISSYVLGSTMLVPPTHVFRDPGPPTQLAPLCTPLISAAVTDGMWTVVRVAIESAGLSAMQSGSKQ